MDKRQILVAVPAQGTDLVGYFNAELKSDFRDVLDFDIVAQNDRAVLDDIEITGVTVTDDQIDVEYSFSFSAYLGCRDQNWDDGESSSVCGSRQGDHWCFDRHVPWVPRSPVDEL
jgi:hypothetical protein